MKSLIALISFVIYTSGVNAGGQVKIDYNNGNCQGAPVFAQYLSSFSSPVLNTCLPMTNGSTMVKDGNPDLMKTVGITGAVIAVHSDGNCASTPFPNYAVATGYQSFFGTVQSCFASELTFVKPGGKTLKLSGSCVKDPDVSNSYYKWQCISSATSFSPNWFAFVLIIFTMLL